MPRSLVLSAVLLLSSALPLAAAQYRAPLMQRAPVIDGRVEPAEWAGACSVDGFCWGGQLEQRRVRAYVGATADTLVLAVVSQLPAEGKLLTDVALDSLKIVYDDSVEVWVDPTPGTERGRTYQLILNAAGRRGWQMHPRGGEAADVGWTGNWQVACGAADGNWCAEIAVPLAQLAPGRRADDGAFGINLCRNWKNPWAFSSLGGGGYAPTDSLFRFGGQAPALTLEHRSDPATGDLRLALIAANTGAQPLSLDAALALTRDVMPELRQQERLELAPGARRELLLETRDESTKKYGLTARAASSDGKEIYFERSYAWKAAPAFIWKTAQAPPPPLDCRFAYYPYRNRMRLQVDVSAMPPEATVACVAAVIRPRAGGAVKTVRFSRLQGGREEQEFSLPELDGSYEIALRAEGEGCPPGETVKSFERTRYPWEHSKLGLSEKVYPPFTPLRVAGNKVSCVLREHVLNAQGLWDQVTAAQAPLLAAPMRLRATIGGRETPPVSSPLRLQGGGNLVRAQGGFSAGPLNCSLQDRLDYDGAMRVDLSLQPCATPVDSLVLEIPLRNEQATMIHAMGDGIRNTIYQQVPPGEGVVWTAEKVAVNDFPRNFCSYLYVGTPVRGLCWFAENDRGWGWNPKSPNLELVRQGQQLLLRVNLINQPTTIDRERTITFGLQAAPIKPRLEPWRYAWWRGKYTVLGTDINWFALGNCGSVYPAGKELYFWEMLKRGNREQLSAEEINKVAEYGRHYYEPYGPEMVETWNRHVQYNLRARYNQQMVLYYNRASYQLADEFQTFEDEWSCTDYRSVGPGKGIGEIKIVPSESYIDHALYWYGKAFDTAGSRGVYWDNMFFCADYNTGMSEAYARPDGSVMPATGIWGLRELTKRAFVYMNERGMPPITMSHMTSTGILPMLSFCTVQYDWEWKYSEGDVQGRFPRDYILLVSNGELAGTWPVLLGDQGKLAEDDWTQRTFAGVALVHEMTPSGLKWPVWKPFVDPVTALLEDRGLQVYRYWDERPQPVQSGNPDLPLIVYALPGREAIVLVTSYADSNLPVQLTIDCSALKMQAVKAIDLESGAEVPVEGSRLAFELKKHDLRGLRLLPR